MILLFIEQTFEYVGTGNGDYIFSHFNALGKVFKWVHPAGGISVGDYVPSRLIVTPKQKQMITSGVEIAITKKLKLMTELAYSKNDVNRFSKLDAKDNESFGGKAALLGTIPFSKDSIPNWFLKTKLDIEARDRNFSPIEQYRAVEFDRDWNTRNQGYAGNQVAIDFRNRFCQSKIWEHKFRRTIFYYRRRLPGA